MTTGIGVRRPAVPLVAGVLAVPLVAGVLAVPASAAQPSAQPAGASASSAVPAGASASSAVPAGASASSAVPSGPGTELHVGGSCSPATADGSPGAPFCTMAAAAAVVQPGQTVLVQPGIYREVVPVTTSGTPGRPITWRAVNSQAGHVRVQPPAGRAAVSLTAVHDVTVQGFSVTAWPDVDPVVVDAAARIVVDDLVVRAPSGRVGVRVEGASDDVRVSRTFVVATGAPAVTVGAGVGGAVLTGNQIEGSVTVTDAPGTVLTGNTLVTGCSAGIRVLGDSAGARLANNIVQPADLSGAVPAPCPDPSAATAIALSAASTADSVADHNLIDPVAGGALYAWGDTSFTDLTAFRDATGQGAHDLAADPELQPRQGTERPWYALDPGSPAVDSADAHAPGALVVDMLGNSRADAPEVPNTGTGSGYRDRGAVEVASPLRADTATVRRKAGGDPFAVTVAVDARWSWPTETVAGTFAYEVNGDRRFRVTDSPAYGFSVQRAGRVCVNVLFSRDAYRTIPMFVPALGGCVVVGADYNPVTPVRLLDTRAATGVPTTVPVAARSEVVLPIERIGDVPAALISAVVLNVTATQPSTAGFLTVYPDGTTRPTTSNVNFVAGETVPNLVTVAVTNGRVRFYNGGSGTVHVVADLQGWYGGTGSGFQPVTPTRVLDTRTNNAPFLPETTRQVDLPGLVPADVTAVAVNVTVTAPTASGVLTLFPAGSSAPTASHLNFVAGQTIPNLVLVPVVDGRVAVHHASAGTSHVVVDLAGWYGPSGGQSFVPISPRRIADTRDGTGLGTRPPGPVAPQAQINVAMQSAEPSFCYGSCPKGIVANVTVTGPTAAGVLTAFPNGTPRPTASNLNFVAGETASNTVVVGSSLGGLHLHNGSAGSSHVIVDQAGYFIDPPA